jgi:hypothetical protein
LPVIFEIDIGGGDEHLDGHDGLLGTAGWFSSMA